MLSRFLKFMIFTQVLVGAGLGYLHHALVGSSLWSLLIGAVLMPLATLVVVIGISAIASNPGESARAWWLSVFGESLAGIRIFLLRQPWNIATPPLLPASAKPDRIPVVLVHGYLCNHRIWDDVINHLHAKGHPVMTVNLEPLFTSIDNYAPIVESAVTELCRQFGTDKVALVGHSMGGLAIRAWMRAHGTHRAARVLTLGTPHAGTQVKPNGKSRNGQQMVWQSQWLNELSASETAATRALFRVAITPQDNIVFPQRAQTLAGVSPVIFEGLGHLQMCLDPAVIAWVTAQLAILGDDAQTNTPSSP